MSGTGRVVRMGGVGEVEKCARALGAYHTRRCQALDGPNLAGTAEMPVVPPQKKSLTVLS